MKTQLSTLRLKVCFAYATKPETITNMFTGREKIELVPSGEVHIFEVVTVKDVEVSRPLSFCKISHRDIGETCKEKDIRPQGLKLCAKCEAAWKKHPRSPWKAFVKGQGIKV